MGQYSYTLLDATKLPAGQFQSCVSSPTSILAKCIPETVSPLPERLDAQAKLEERQFRCRDATRRCLPLVRGLKPTATVRDRYTVT